MGTKEVKQALSFRKMFPFFLNSHVCHIEIRQMKHNSLKTLDNVADKLGVRS